MTTMTKRDFLSGSNVVAENNMSEKLKRNQRSLRSFCPYFDRCVIIWAFYGPKVVKRRHSAILTFGTLLQLLFIGHRQI